MAALYLLGLALQGRVDTKDITHGQTASKLEGLDPVNSWRIMITLYFVDQESGITLNNLAPRKLRVWPTHGLSVGSPE